MTTADYARRRLVDVTDLHVHFATDADIVEAVDGVSFHIAMGVRRQHRFRRPLPPFYKSTLQIDAAHREGRVPAARRDATGELWCSTNERDGLGDNLVPDYITHLEEDGFYGWPWFYMGGHQDPRHKGKHRELKAKVLAPDVLLQPHFASLEMLLYRGRSSRRVPRTRLRGRARLVEPGEPRRLPNVPHDAKPLDIASLMTAISAGSPSSRG